MLFSLILLSIFPFFLLKPSAVFVWYCSLIAFAETVLPYLKQTKAGFTFQLFAPTHSQILYPNATFRSGYAENHYHQRVCDTYAMRGTCPQEDVTHFPGHTHLCIYIRTRGVSQFQLYPLVWGSFRSPPPPPTPYYPFPYCHTHLFIGVGNLQHSRIPNIHVSRLLNGTRLRARVNLMGEIPMSVNGRKKFLPS